MRICLSFFFLFISLPAFSVCRFKTHVTKVYSLSGVTSVYFRELGLLKNSIIKAISVFNPIGNDEFSGTRYPGGIFLSRNVLQEFSGGLVFYDESRELAHILDPMSSIQGIQIKTRGLSPIQVGEMVFKELSHFLDGCDEEIMKIQKKTSQLAQEYLSEVPQGRTVVYYLGDLQERKEPELIMVQDGIVKWLIEQKKIRTYPSPLAYVHWSKKMMKEMPANTLHILVKDSGADLIKKTEKKGKFWILTYPGSLVPGLTQLEAWKFFEESTSP
jgi:hypothetical protein